MRAHVVLPGEMVEEIDRIAGKRGRSRFIEEAVSDRLRRERLKKALKETVGMLDPEKYPEWSTPEKTTQWVHDMREREAEELGRKIEGWHAFDRERASQ